MEDIEQLFSEVASSSDLSQDLVERVKTKLKETYDRVKKDEKTTKSNALPELITKQFDLEQIWQQIELQNEEIINRALVEVSRFAVQKHKLVFKNLESQMLAQQEGDSELENNADKAVPVVAEGLDDEDVPVASDEDVPVGSDDDDENIPSSDDFQAESIPAKKHKPSVVDDDFFKLDEMEDFLKTEERKLDGPDSGNDSVSESESDVDLFEGGIDEDDEQPEQAKYKDFFVRTDEIKSKKRNKIMEALEQEDNDSDEEENVQDKSMFELRQERLQAKYEKLEERAISEKPWHLKGEITNEDRPYNALLEKPSEFDMTSRPAPVMTEYCTQQLEDIIRQRIKDKTFDDVERKAKPIETPLEFKKKLVLDQEKSKKSLAQIYENEYLEQKASMDPDYEKTEEEPPVHKEIKTMMADLFHSLDALSNFHFTPKPAVPELQIVSNKPAISMEEVAPVTSSDAALLAPQEVKRKLKGEMISQSERTKTDKNRQRRKKKLKQKVHSQVKEKQEFSGNTKSKLAAKNKKIVKGKNIDKMDESVGSKSVKSSSAFFAQLEDEVKLQIKRPAKRKHTENISLIKLK